MPAKQTVSFAKKQLAIGDLKHRVQIQVRNLQAPGFEGVDFDLEHKPSGGLADVWARVEPVAGRVMFNGISNEDVQITHMVYMRFREDVTSESRLLFKGTRLYIANVQNYNNEKRFLALSCTELGPVSTQATKL